MDNRPVVITAPAQRRYQRREHVTLRRAFLSGHIRTLQPGKPARGQEIKNRHRASAPTVDFVREKQNQERISR